MGDAANIHGSAIQTKTCDSEGQLHVPFKGHLARSASHANQRYHPLACGAVLCRLRLRSFWLLQAVVRTSTSWSGVSFEIRQPGAACSGYSFHTQRAWI